MAIKEKIKTLTVSLYEQENKRYHGPIHTIPDAMEEKSIDKVEIYDHQGQLMATMDYQILESIIEEYM